MRKIRKRRTKKRKGDVIQYSLNEDLKLVNEKILYLLQLE